MSIVLTHKGADPVEMTRLIRVAKSSDPKASQAAKAKIVEIYRDVVENQAKSYIRRGRAAKGLAISGSVIKSMGFDEDIISAAWEGFFKALSVYDPDRGVPFRSFFMYHILHRCTCEFGAYMAPVSGTYSGLWRKFMQWCKANPQPNRKDWSDIIRVASAELGVRPIEIQDILNARGFLSSDEREGFISTALDSRQVGVPSPARAMEIALATFKAAGSRSYYPTRLEVAREIIRKVGGDGDPEVVAQTREFRLLYRKHVTDTSDDVIRRSRIRSRATRKVLRAT